MADKPWKAWERDVAKALGGTRSGPTGHDVPDSVDVELVAPEAKLYTKFTWFEKDWQQAVENAAKHGGKIPIVAQKEKKRGGGRARVQIAWRDFVTIYWLARKGAECLKQETTCKCADASLPGSEAACAAPS